MTLLLALACSSPEPGTTTPVPTPSPAPVPTPTPTPTPSPTPSPTPTPTPSPQPTADTSSATTLPEGLHGIPPATPVGPPTFTATNRDGSPRGQADLIGQPTILWFYPAAGTGG